MLYLFKQKGGSAKERLGSSIQKFGVVQLHLGLGCLIVAFVSIGIDRKNFNNPVEKYNEEGINNGTAFDKTYAVLGLDVGAAISAVWISGLLNVVITGVVPACMARNTEYNLIKTKVVCMVLGIISASLFVPISVGAAVATYVLRGSHIELAVILGVLSLLEFIVAIVSSAYCCMSPWGACKLKKKDKEKKNIDNGHYEKQLPYDELPPYTA